MMTPNELDLLKRRFKRAFGTRYGKVYYSEQERVLLCIVTQPYIPIANFRRMFERMAKLVRRKNLTKFIFDKRALKSFDQPSMEWYFTTWKEEMYAIGLRTHRKILPPENWFAQAVIAGRADILKKYPENVAFRLDIQYCSDLRDALEKPERPPHSKEEYLSLSVL